ncbi:MAG: efflux RND transporter periplasmic adaptor subunit [Rhodoferax sp.]|nr:efflux RND transporter periplasmic adaptor subunit [Rhodoferax sp.]
MRILPFRGLAIVLAPALALVVASCSRPTAAPEPVRAVKLMTVQVGQMHAQPEFAGEVRARTELRLGFRVAGKILRRPAEIGQRVKRGDLLAQLDPQDLRLATQAAQAQVTQAQTSRDLAVNELQRAQSLKEQNFISGVEVDRRQATLNAAQAQVAQVQAQLKAQSNQSGYSDLVAPMAGTITAVEAEPGQVVAVGAPIVRIAQDGPLDVWFSVPESSIAAIGVGSAAQVRVWSTGAVYQGSVREKGALADPVTRTFQIKLALGPDVRLPLGSTVTVIARDLSSKGQAVIKLPTSALKQDASGSAVWVLEPASMTLRSQPVQLVAADGNEVVVASGLEPGMQVVIAGVHVLTQGQKVSIYRPVAQAATDAAVSATPAPAR